MTIKSDRWIREKCQPPNFIVTEYRRTLNSIMPGHYETVNYPSYNTAEYLEREVELSSTSFYGVRDFRALNYAEVSAFKPMISPFEPAQVRYNLDNLNEKVISYGLSSYGYDIRCADEFKVFTNINSTMVDPKDFREDCFVNVSGKGYCIIPPNSFALARTVETFKIPRNVLTICLGKSTYARIGLIVNVTPFEPEFEGQVVLEFSNTTPLPAKVYANEGCAQVVFFESDEACEVSYKDRGGKYQNQTGIVTSRV